ncbi:Glycosidase [Catalinimonas alkaloidigena]|uniref:Glycosidase n=1 Tax=Catalinimonas alkaloidigena TaxID=1075417 RepID=A0A1G9MUR3_9BACT|nr:alpha-amylase family glycosyl hydrolase [Catalinimonas alkaloidigena]SDL77751.1 Glycosidase [Catalinimonas alkaloidigena]
MTEEAFSTTFTKHLAALLLLWSVVTSCTTNEKSQTTMSDTTAAPSATSPEDHKLIIYQMMTRLFGNTTTTNKPWGTRDENGVGKFNDISDRALQEIRDLGATYVWYTGVIEHAVCTDYTAYGIPYDDADVVKGRAGSPYAIKDYYDVNPDLAVDVPNRMQEFETLVARTHRNGLKVLIDFVPNHVARSYHSDANPNGMSDFGVDDNTSVAFDAQNNFYYIPGEKFRVPKGYKPLGGLPFPTADGKFDEMPAKVSGNGAVTAQPQLDDWFETVRLNYGVNYVGDYSKHFDPIPSTWLKCLDILTYWAKKDVDGFRCDMAEMVPVEFWGWVIPKIKEINPDIRFIAEIYNPAAYRSYIFDGKFDYLYDKVGLYDSIRAVMADHPHASAEHFTTIWQSQEGISAHMLRFLENHDEQRIASPDFAGNAQTGIPGMIVTATLSEGPVMVYFGQEVGEPAQGASGFSGDDGRTTIFDYWGVPEHQKWMNNHAFDGGLLSPEQRSLREFYKKLLRATRQNEALAHGALYDLQYANLDRDDYPAHRVYAYLRHTENSRVLVVANFSRQSESIRLRIPFEAGRAMKLDDRPVGATDIFSGSGINLDWDQAAKEGIPLKLPPLSGCLYAF